MHGVKFSKKCNLKTDLLIGFETLDIIQENICVNNLMKHKFKAQKLKAETQFSFQ